MGWPIDLCGLLTRVVRYTLANVVINVVINVVMDVIVNLVTDVNIC